MSNPVAWSEAVGKSAATPRSFYGRLFGCRFGDSTPEMYHGPVDSRHGGIPAGFGPGQDGDSGRVTRYVEVDDRAVLGGSR